MKRIDLNVDLGEGFPHDEALLRIATSANVGCGEHAGSWETTLETAARCRKLGVRIGAHPGYPDRASMGRRPLDAADPEIRASLHEQVRRFASACAPAYVKPHGAFYNAIAACDAAAIALCAELMELAGTDLLMGQPGTGHEQVGARLIREGFADRRYLEDWRLAPRTEPGAVLTDPDAIAAQVLSLVERVDSICVHGDEPHAPTAAALVRRTLEAAGYEVGW